MPDFKSARIFWYSGTGNSYIVAVQAAQTLVAAGIKTRMIQINSALQPEFSADDLLGFVFPIAVAGTYPFIWDFFSRLPAAKNPVFMLDTLGGYSGGIKGPLAKHLMRKGYKPVGAEEIIMPENFPPGREITAAGRARIEPGLQKAEKFVQSLLDNSAQWNDVPFWSDLLGVVCRFKAPWSTMRRIFSLRINAEKCIKCGLCVKLCPVNNISGGEKSVPVIDNGCQSCMRCIAFCPVGAITTRGGSGQKLKSCNVDELLATERLF